MRQIILDTETTGLDPRHGHRIIEIGAIELIDRRLTGAQFHTYINPDREIDPGAEKVHGLSNVFLSDKPRFKEVVDEFITFVKDAELVIHNAPFDVGFINAELKLIKPNRGHIEKFCQIFDTLVLARKLHPGQKNNLDVLCKRYAIDNSHRDLHGALMDAKILAHVYLAMTTGQEKLSLDQDEGSLEEPFHEKIHHAPLSEENLKAAILKNEEAQAHQEYIEFLRKTSGDDIIQW